MLVLVLGALGFVPALALGLLARGRSLPLFGLGVLGVGAWFAFSVWAASRPCGDNAECTPGLGAFFAAFVLAGWMLGLVGARVLRRRPFRQFQ